MEQTRVLACADLSAERLDRIARRFPDVRTTTDHRTILSDKAIDAVIITTPTGTHATIATQALRAGKHVLVEKPMCTTSAEAQSIVELAEDTGLVVMVGYVFLFNSGIIRLKELIAAGDLGALHYLDAVRTNLGPIRGDVNAFYDLGTHDITIMNFLIGSTPTAVSAQGRCITQEGIEDVCFATLKYAGGTLGHIHASWLSPRKMRTLTVVGERKMAHWDDVDPSDTLRVYDKGLEEPPYYDSFGDFRYLLRSADVSLPAIRQSEPLVKQAEAFVGWIKTGEQCGPDARDGLSVIRVLEAATESIRTNGAMCSVGGASKSARVVSERSARVPNQSLAQKDVAITSNT
jgi:predicted dehydrogenase